MIIFIFNIVSYFYGNNTTEDSDGVADKLSFFKEEGIF